VQRATERAAAADREERAAHRRALQVLQEHGFEPMVGGAYALRAHTSIWRDTKDLDLFLAKNEIEAALAALDAAGFRTEFTDPLWLAKAFDGDYFVDLIFSSGNGIAIVDDEWRRRALHGSILDRDTLVVPAEEMIWQKAFIQERERFDGADIHHLLRCKGEQLDWRHLMSRFGGDYFEVLLVHLVTFRFAFPSHKEQVPSWVMKELLSRLQRREEDPDSAPAVCRGTLLSRQQYLHETNVLGYRDARELEVQGWTGDRAYPVKYPPAGNDDAYRGGR